MTLTEHKYIVAVAREKHVGRAADACFISQPTPSVSIKKLDNDGFQIAKQDLEIRGPGEFLGARQSGAVLLRFCRPDDLYAAIANRKIAGPTHARSTQ
jgi:RecG-like helicase